MSGLLALLDDVVALMKAASAGLDDIALQTAKAGSKAAGVVIDDAAVTPRYVMGLAAERELPIIAKIAAGSLFNKLVILLPVALLLSTYLPAAITPLLMIGGLYLCFEGYEKVHHMVAGHDKTGGAAEQADAAATLDAAAQEKARVAGAIRTDFILSAEIMAIALASMTAPDFSTKALSLASVAIAITVIVYGTVALLVKADDFGARLAWTGGPVTRRIGYSIVKGMPHLLGWLAFIGMLAMLWVGGDILIHGLAELGIKGPEQAIYAMKGVAKALPIAQGFVGWLIGAAAAAIVGVVAGGATALLYGAFAPMLGGQSKDH